MGSKYFIIFVLAHVATATALEILGNTSGGGGGFCEAASAKEPGIDLCF